MSQAGKFIPGGAGRKVTQKLRTGPIRAPDGPPGEEGAPKKGKGANRLLQRAGGLTKQVPKNRRLPIMIMSGLVCCLLVSVAWYEVGVLPAKREAEMERQKEIAAQKELADNLAAQKAAEEARLKAEQNAKATVIVSSQPAGSVTIGNEHKSTPATFDDVTPGKITVTIDADGYETYSQDMTVAADKPTDLGTVQLVPQSGNLSLSSPQSDVTYTLTGAEWLHA